MTIARVTRSSQTGALIIYAAPLQGTRRIVRPPMVPQALLALLAPLALMALFVGLTTAATPSASAEAGGPWAHAPLAAMEVRAMVSSEKGDGLWRALVVSSGGASAIVVEHFARGRLLPADGRPHVQRRIERFAYGSGSLSFTGQVDRFADLRFDARALAFDAIAGGDILRCRVPLYGTHAFAARCRPSVDHAPPYAAAPPAADLRPVPVNWSWRPRITRACREAFTTSSGVSLCLDAVADAPSNPQASIIACAAHLDSESSMLRCLELTIARRGSSPALIGACDDAMYGDNNAMACLSIASRAPWNAEPSVAACDTAMYGDESALECIDIATRSPWEASQTITRCAARSANDRGALTCLARAGSD